MKKKTSSDILYLTRSFKIITDLDILIKDLKEECKEKGIKIGRICVEPGYLGIDIGLYKELTFEEKEILKNKEIEAQIKAKKILAEKLEKEQKLIEEKQARALKASEAAKKGWIERSKREAKRKEADRIAMEKYILKKAKDKAEKEAKKAEEERAKQFLHDLLYGEE